VTPYKLDVLQLTELVQGTVLCPDCLTEIVLRLDRVVPPVPAACPSCGKRFDENIGKIIGNLREAFLLTKHTPFHVKFHITESTEKKPANQ
jgi:hypothetical protein